VLAVTEERTRPGVRAINPPTIVRSVLNLSEATSRKPLPTIIHGVLFLPRDGLGTRSELPERNSVMSRAALLDVSGRKVLDLHAGANDVQALTAGVYFVRTAQAQAQVQAIRKVVVTR
jgi:hypothetical protein